MEMVRKSKCNTAVDLEKKSWPVSNSVGYIMRKSNNNVFEIRG